MTREKGATVESVRERESSDLYECTVCVTTMAAEGWWTLWEGWWLAF